MSRARESATRSEAILDKKARQKAAAARKRSEKKQREGQRTIPSLRVPTSTPAPSGPVTPAREARGARRRKRGAGAARDRGDARRRPRPGAGVAGMGSVEASAGFSRRRRSVQEAKEKLRNPGGARTGGGLSRFIVGSRSAVLRSCADSFRGRDEERSRTIGRRRRVPSLRPLSPPSTSARPPPPQTPVVAPRSPETSPPSVRLFPPPERSSPRLVSLHRVRGEHETDGNEQHGHQHVRLVLLGEETLERLAERSEDVPRGLRAEERAKRGVTSDDTSRREAPTPAADAARPEGAVPESRGDAPRAAGRTHSRTSPATRTSDATDPPTRGRNPRGRV